MFFVVQTVGLQEVVSVNQRGDMLEIAGLVIVVPVLHHRDAAEEVRGNHRGSLHRLFVVRPTVRTNIGVGVHQYLNASISPVLAHQAISADAK